MRIHSRFSTALLVSLCPWIVVFGAEGDDTRTTMPDIVVLGTPAGSPGSEMISGEELSRAPAADGGDLLRAVNGVSAGRMGGRGLDPAIRGQSQGRINVLVDGAYVFGACPNRMDPPSAFAAPYSWDQVLVLKGVQTLRWGGGGSGGTVIFQRETWPDERGVTGRAGLAASSNGTNQSLFGDLQFAGEKYYLRGRLFEEDAGDYEDGNGDSVRSAYEERGAAVETGLTVTGADRLEFSADVT
ncbi:MAG: TonB-dependent receptor plug domain-containing protein, partial [Gammaproteobacteria bacterium]